MLCAIIDIGSDAMRLTVYDVEGRSFRTVFQEKSMTAPAGFMEKGRLSREGINAVCETMIRFRERLDTLKTDHISILAGASLRNVENTEAVLKEISLRTGFETEVLSGQEEAICGFIGAMCDIDVKEGVFTDVGGGSTEISVFAGESLRTAESYPVGSVSLYRECVRNLLPEKRDIRQIRKTIRRELKKCYGEYELKEGRMTCVGGTARTAMKLARKVFSLPPDQNYFTYQQLEQLSDMLIKGDRRACSLILKIAPERIHTIVPGIMILRHIAEKFEISSVTVSRYGVREGYLCRKTIMKI